MEMKMKVKPITPLLVALFLIPIIAIGTTATATAGGPNITSKIDIMAKGVDIDITGAITFIKGSIEFDEDTGEVVGQFQFHVKIYNELGEKIYSMQGKLKGGAVMIIPQYYCTVRDVWWTNVWVVMDTGLVKTSDADLTIDYRGALVTLPNTENKWVEMTLCLMFNPTGEYVGGVWEEGGWAFAGIPGFFGGCAYLTKYVDTRVPEEIPI